jgi:predicted metal-dependent peptidase
MDISAEANSILMAEPFLMTFVHQLKHYEMRDEDREIIACTDGNVVEYGPKYAMLDLPERTYICLHELGHGMFLHSRRAMLWLMYNGSLFPALWNYAADVVINEGIEANPMMRTGLFQSPGLFPPCRMKTTIHDVVAEAAAASGEPPPSDYSPSIARDLRVETLYQWLVWALFAMRRHRKQDPMTGRDGQGVAGGAPGVSEDRRTGEGGRRGRRSGKPGDGRDAPTPETRIERMEREDAWDLREHAEEVRRLLSEGRTAEDVARAIEKEVEEARQRIAQAVQGAKIAGVGQGSMLMNLSSDLPAPTVPWHRLIRHVLDGALGTRMAESYTRPGNATLCAMALRRRDLPVSHGTTIYSPQPRILVGLDVSGSMMSELRRCCAEVWSMAQMKNAAIDLVTWDDGVQERLTIADRRDFDRILRRGLRGGGGSTVVRQLFDQARRDGHRAIVVMTDGYVSIDLPERPTIPVIWAITPGGATAGLEAYGTIVRMAPEPRVAIDKLALAA